MNGGWTAMEATCVSSNVILACPYWVTPTRWAHPRTPSSGKAVARASAPKYYMKTTETAHWGGGNGRPIVLPPNCERSVVYHPLADNQRIRIHVVGYIASWGGSMQDGALLRHWHKTLLTWVIILVPSVGTDNTAWMHHPVNLLWRKEVSYCHMSSGNLIFMFCIGVHIGYTDVDWTSVIRGEITVENCNYVSFY